MTSRLHAFVSLTAVLMLTACSSEQPEPSTPETVPRHEATLHTSTPDSTVKPRPVAPPEWALTSEEYAALPAMMEPLRPIHIQDYDDGDCVVLPGGLLHKQDVPSAGEFAVLPPGSLNLNIKLRYETVEPHTIEHAYVGSEYYPECNDGKIVYLGDYMLDSEYLKVR